MISNTSIVVEEIAPARPAVPLTRAPQRSATRRTEPIDRRILILRLIVVGLALYALASHLMHSAGELGKMPFDDAYMFVRYARHWLAGDGFCWNVSDGPAYGTTSAAYLAVITGLRGMTDIADATLLTGASLAAGLAAALALCALGFIAPGGGKLKKAWIPLLVLPCLLPTHLFRYHSLTGMDATLSLFGNALLACAVAGWSRHHSLWRLALCLFAAWFSFLARPDNGLYSLVLPPLFILATERARWRHAVQYLILFSLLLLLDGLAKTILFGGFIPLPFFAKRGGFYDGYTGGWQWNAMAQMISFWRGSLPFLIVITLAISTKTMPFLSAIAFPIFATLAYYATVVQFMGWGARYYYPSLPFLVLGAFIALYHPGMPLLRSRWSLSWRAGVVLLITLPVFITPFVAGACGLWERVAMITPAARRAETIYRSRTGILLPPIGWWKSIREMTILLDRLPRNIVFAASEYGVIGARLPDLTIIDLAGLNDRNMSRNGFSEEYLFSRRPDVIWLPHPDYTGAVADILDCESFARDYEYYPGLYDYGLALDRQSPHFPAIRRRLEIEFERLYPDLTLSDHLAAPAGHGANGDSLAANGGDG